MARRRSKKTNTNNPNQRRIVRRGRATGLGYDERVTIAPRLDGLRWCRGRPGVWLEDTIVSSTRGEFQAGGTCPNHCRWSSDPAG